MRENIAQVKQKLWWRQLFFDVAVLLFDLASFSLVTTVTSLVPILKIIACFHEDSHLNPLQEKFQDLLTPLNLHNSQRKILLKIFFLKFLTRIFFTNLNCLMSKIYFQIIKYFGRECFGNPFFLLSGCRDGLVSSIGLKIDFKGDPIFESAARFFVIILKFIFTSILKSKFIKKNSLIPKKFHFRRPIFNKHQYIT